MKKLLWILLVLSAANLNAQTTKPRLVVQLVVDQLRGDLLEQHKDQLSKTGFNYLLSNSLNFANAHHPHANTTTCAGHATISTGSYPSLHGIIDNDWYDRKTRKLVYCTEDLNTAILATQHTRVTIAGRSPRNIKQSTLSDEFILANKGKAFGVSLKDRAAITLAGHAGKAFWFDKTNGGFVTSAYYYAGYPQWVQNWNMHYKPSAYHWELAFPIDTYKNAKNLPFRHNYGSFGQTFPHHVVNPPSEEYFKWLSRTPTADKLTGEFAAELLVQEKLGQNEGQTDYLGVSFSAVDAIGHQFGPNSLESEDNLLALDITIGKLLATIDKQVGLDKVLIILTADHGVSDGPSYLRAHHIAEIKPISLSATEQFIKTKLLKRFNLPAQTLMAIVPPYIYLDHDIIDDHKLSLTTVSNYLAESLILQPGIFRAYSLPVTPKSGWLNKKVDRMAYPNRAGDVYLVQPPYQSYGSKKEDRVAHGSPWQYDSFVPLLFVNPKFKHKTILRPVYSTDIATTIATLLKIKSPSGSVGQPLIEVITAYNHQDKQRQ